MERMGNFKKGVLALVVFLFFVGTVPADTITVGPGGPGGGYDYATIQEGVDAAVSEVDTVVVADGIYTGDGNRDIDFLGKAITVRSENGATNCIVDCNGSQAEPHRGFYFGSNEGPNSVVDGLTITNGYSDDCGPELYDGGGGGILCKFSSPTIKNCIIKDNTVYRDHVCCYDCFGFTYSGGGGISCGISAVKIINCIFYGNTATGNGGAVRISANGELQPEILNCTFYANQTSDWYGGGAISTVGDSGIDKPIKVSNCIVWGNVPATDPGIASCNIGKTAATVGYVDFSVLQSSWYGDGHDNIVADPCFMDPEYGDFHLHYSSPCINAGDPNYVPEANETDMDGQPRIIGGRLDMGADEFNADDTYIGVAPREFDFLAVMGGPNPQPQILSVFGVAGRTINWEITEDCSWLQADPNSGESSTGDVNEVSLNVDITSLTTGDYNCTLTIWDPNAINSPKTVNINLVVDRPAIELSPTQFSFIASEGGPNPETQVLSVRNSGIGTLNWQLFEDCAWLDANPTNGVSTGEPNDVILSVNISDLSQGEYNCVVMISDPCAANSPQSVDVTLVIDVPEIGLSASQFNLAANEGGANPGTQVLSVHNAGLGTLNWQLFEDCPWLEANPTSGVSTGEPNDVILSVDISGLNSGGYGTVLTITDPCASNNPQNVNVSLVVHGPKIKLSPSQFHFSGYKDTPDPCDQLLTVSNIGGGTLNWSISYDCSWLDIGPISGHCSAIEPNEVTLSVDITGLDKGPYNCDFTVSDPNAENSPYSMEVTLYICDANAVNDCFPCAHPDYVEWVAVGKPDSWCYPRQCHGDADGERDLIGKCYFWVGYDDLDIFLEGFGELEYIDPVTDPWIAADFNHQLDKVGKVYFRVGYGDLDIFVANFAAYPDPEPDCLDVP